MILKDKEQAEELSIIENVQRKDLHPLELSSALNKLLEKGYKQKQICEKLSLGKSYVSEIIKLNDLGEKTKTFVMEKNITSRDILRDLSSGKKTLSEVAKIVSSTHKQEYRRSKSVFRIGILDGEYIVQKNFLDKLTKEQKKSLKKELDLIISEHLSY